MKMGIYRNCHITSHHNVIPTPFGVAAIIYRENPFSLTKVLLPCPSKKDLIESLSRAEWGKTGSHPNAVIVSESIFDYFQGKPISPPWEWMDLSGFTSLQRSVLAATADIPYGQLRSYRQIAEAIGRPRAHRFVGTTLAKNRFPLLIPCHRVIKSDSSVGHFSGGTGLKRKLIELEAGRHRL